MQYPVRKRIFLLFCYHYFQKHLAFFVGCDRINVQTNSKEVWIWQDGDGSRWEASF